MVLASALFVFYLLWRVPYDAARGGQEALETAQLLPPDLVTMSVADPLPPETISALGDRGYRVEPHSWEFGDVQVIWRDGDELIPAADPRDRGVGRVITITAEQSPD